MRNLSPTSSVSFNLCSTFFFLSQRCVWVVILALSASSPLFSVLRNRQNFTIKWCPIEPTQIRLFSGRPVGICADFAIHVASLFCCCSSTRCLQMCLRGLNIINLKRSHFISGNLPEGGKILNVENPLRTEMFIIVFYDVVQNGN